MSRVHSLGQFIPSLGISSRSLERVNLTKLLGIHFSEHLSWEDCMSTNCQKSCHSALGILRKIKNFTRNTYLAITLAKLKLSPVRLGTGWVMNIVLKVPTFFYCFFFPYCLNWNALWRNINELVWEVRPTDNCSFISIFDHSYFEAISSNCFNVFC